jgi:hypothetical protein
MLSLLKKMRRSFIGALKMRQYLIDEVSKADIEKIRSYLNSHADPSSLEGLYWLPLKSSLLRGIQVEHKTCQPYCVAVELGRDFVKFELLIRSRVRHNCTCSRYAVDEQREFIIGFAERLIEELGIRT